MGRGRVTSATLEGIVVRFRDPVDVPRSPGRLSEPLVEFGAGLRLVAEVGPARLDTADSLKEAWRRSGGRWSRLKQRLLDGRGDRCAICGSHPDTLEAHETWRHVDAGPDDLARDGIEQAVAARYAMAWRFYEAHVARRAPLPPRMAEPTPKRLVVKELVDVLLLCHACHVCKHTRDRRYAAHWCRVNDAPAEAFEAHYAERMRLTGPLLIVGARYGSWPTLPDYPSLEAWQAAVAAGAPPPAPRRRRRAAAVP